MKILVTGAREWTDRETIHQVLTAFPSRQHLIVGDCRGVDRIAASVARSLNWTVEVHEAQWDLYGKEAGPIRNGKMLLRKPDRVVAFHNDLWKSKGTWHMVQISRRVGVPTQLYWSSDFGKDTLLGAICDVCWHSLSHSFCPGKIDQLFLNRYSNEWIRERRFQLNDPCPWLACEPIVPTGNEELDMLVGDSEGYCCQCHHGILIQRKTLQVDEGD